MSEEGVSYDAYSTDHVTVSKSATYEHRLEMLSEAVLALLGTRAEECACTTRTSRDAEDAFRNLRKVYSLVKT